MPSIRDLRRRIRSVENTKQITRAMQMVAAARLRRAQAKVEAARPYASKMQEMLASLASAATALEHPLFQKREVRKVGLVVITSDRGLCGSYNANVIRNAELFLRERAPDNTLLALVGKKGFDFYHRRRWELRLKYLDLGGNLVLTRTRRIASDLTNLFLSGEVDEIHLLYTRFVSTVTYRVTREKFLPIEPQKSAGDSAGALDYIFEPGPEQIFQTLLPRFCLTRVQIALAEAFASEHGSRMIAMTSATQNALEMIDHLTLVRNKVRQASITKEMLEIVGGAEALK